MRNLSKNLVKIILLFICISHNYVYANDFSLTNYATMTNIDIAKCKTMENGQCIEFYEENKQIEKKCKTMENGQCIEYYNVNDSYNLNVKKEIVLKPLENKKEIVKHCENSFGFSYILDPYANNWATWEVYNQSKVFVTDVEMGSPAHRVGLKIGDEIRRINDIRIVKFRADDLDNYVNNQIQMELDIKSVDGKKKTVKIVRGSICRSKETEPLFDSYWKQICPYDIDEGRKTLNSIGRVANKLTPQFKKDYSNWQYEVDGWFNKRNQFRNGFNLCLLNYQNQKDANLCINQIVARSIGMISHEQNLEMQRTTLQVQQEMNRQQVNAMNNYSNALQNQYMRIDQNVRHSGTVNVNKNVNSNVNIKDNYYYW